MMNNPGERGVTQAFFSIAEASDKGKTVAGFTLGVAFRNIL